jgi:peptidoglycan hydrolase-like protein with peptidoglycan-binding domain
MAEPRIKPALESAEFTTEVTPSVRTRLESCLRSDPAHIMPKSRGGQDGPHVEALQKALKKIKAASPPELGMLDIIDPPGVYGQSTANAVRRYKEVNAIQRMGQPLDEIVGRMTIIRMDDELKNLRFRPGPSPRPPSPDRQPRANRGRQKHHGRNRK